MEQKTEQKKEQKLLPAGKKTAWGQWAGAVAVVVVLVGLGYFIVHNRPASPAASTSAEDQAAALAAAGAAKGVTHTFEWSFAIVGGDPKTGADKSSVTLSYDGQSKVVGTYDGHCTVLSRDAASTWPLEENELTGVVCYWAGAGDEAGVFLEDGKYVVKHGTISEPTEDEAAFRGAYEPLFSI